MTRVSDGTGRRAQRAEAPDLYLFAFRIDPAVADPELYTLFVYAEDDRPLTQDGQLLFFATPALAVRALELAGLRARFPGAPPSEAALTCDVALALHLIAEGDEDRDSLLLNALNTLLDMVAATQLAVPSEHRRTLHALADHLTFDRDLAAFFAQPGQPRIAAQDALLWALGAIAARARIVR